jgi:hypothetical protein
MENEAKRLDLTEKIKELSINFNAAMKEVENEEETYWNSLTKEQQLCAFNSVCRRIIKGELQDKGTYRYVLYSVFGFGPEAYARAQMAGYLEIHNSIWDSQHEERLLTAFAKSLGVEDAETKAKNFLTSNL